MKSEKISLFLYRAKLEDDSRKLKDKDRSELHKVQKLLKKISQDKFELTIEDNNVIYNSLMNELKTLNKYGIIGRKKEVEEKINQYSN